MKSFENSVLDRLQNLEFNWKKIAYSYSVCVRLFPNYVDFVEAEKWGDRSGLDYGLSLIRDFLILDIQPNAKELTSVQEIIHSAIPDSEDFPSTRASRAARSASAIYYTLKNIHDPIDSELRWVFNCPLESIDLLMTGGEIFYELAADYQNNSNPLIVTELEKQRSDYLLLLTASKFSGQVQNTFENQ